MRPMKRGPYKKVRRFRTAKEEYDSWPKGYLKFLVYDEVDGEVRMVLTKFGQEMWDREHKDTNKDSV